VLVLRTLFVTRYDKLYARARKKMDRLGLEVVDLKGLRTTTSLKIPKELPTVEETSAREVETRK